MNEKSSNSPLDDQGIKNDEIIDIVEKIVHSTWEDVCLKNTELTFEERRDAIETVQSAWDLAMDVINIDEQLRDIMEHMSEDFDEDDDDIDF